jgi:hypothetical protein
MNSNFGYLTIALAVMTVRKFTTVYLFKVTFAISRGMIMLKPFILHTFSKGLKLVLGVAFTCFVFQFDLKFVWSFIKRGHAPTTPRSRSSLCTVFYSTLVEGQLNLHPMLV